MGESGRKASELKASICTLDLVRMADIVSIEKRTQRISKGTACHRVRNSTGNAAPGGERQFSILGEFVFNAFRVAGIMKHDDDKWIARLLELEFAGFPRRTFRKSP